MIQKYSKVTKEDYRNWYLENGKMRECARSDKKSLKYHLMPASGWLNDPNGLHQMNGEYRIYYQYDPFDTEGLMKLWGLYTTKDFVHYEEKAPVLFPDHELDKHGVYSGSAFVENDMIHYFYTGNVKYFDREDYDYINSGRGSNTIHVTSRDGVTMSEKQCVLSSKDYPEDMSCHVRDPKVFSLSGKYYMVLGARDQQGKGLVLLYESDDLNTWKYKNRITTEVPFGYMWECPDLFELNGEWYLTCCPQGVEQNGLDYANVHQSCWMKIDADFDNNHFEVKEIHQLDRGTDFYAQQSFVDEKGRRIMIGWLGIPDADYTNPTVDHQWQHALTLPRELVVKNGNLCQKPIDEIYQLRGSHKTCSLNENVSWEELQYECDMHFDICNTFKMHLRKGLTLSYKNDVLELSFDKNGYGRSERAVHCGKLSDLQIFMDTTSVEIFVNGGIEVFTCRFYGMETEFLFDGEAEGTMNLYQMHKFSVNHTEEKGLCVIGEALIDFVPDVKGLALKDVPSFHRAAGGAPANVAGAVSKMGLPAKVLTKLGEDAFGDYIVETLQESGIDTSAILRDREYETSLAFVSLREDGNRDFAFYRKNSADLHLTEEEIPENILDDCGMIHFCSVDLVESSMKEAHRKLIAMAKEKGLLISFDPNLRLSLWESEECLKNTVKEFLPLADIVKISDEELEFITGKTDIEEALPDLLQGNTKCVVYTMGKDGAAVYTKNLKAVSRGYCVDVVDTTGAGDSFIGAFEYQLLRDGVENIEAVSKETFEEYLKFANAYAAYTTTKAGALSSMANASEMEAWLNKIQ